LQRLRGLAPAAEGGATAAGPFSESRLDVSKFLTI